MPTMWISFDTSTWSSADLRPVFRPAPQRPNTAQMTRRVVRSIAEFDVAAADPQLAAGGPEVIYLTQSVSGSLKVHGPKLNGPATSGQMGAVKWIELAPGVTVDGGSGSSTDAAIDIAGVDHWSVANPSTVGGVHGVRFRGVRGSALGRLSISGGHCRDAGGAKVLVCALDAATPSTHVDVDSAEVSGISSSAASKKLSQGIRIGGALPGWQDQTFSIRVRSAYAHHLEAEAIVLAPGVTSSTIESPRVANINLSGRGDSDAAICMSYATSSAPAQFIDGVNNVCRWARIWNIVDGAAIQVGYGGTEVYDCIAWNYSDELVRLVSAADPGDGIIGARRMVGRDGGIYHRGNIKGGKFPHVLLRDIVSDPAGPRTVDQGYDATDFLGPLTGNADAGLGPGSGFAWAANAPHDFDSPTPIMAVS